MGAVSAKLGKPFFPSQQFIADVAGEVDPATGGPWYETVIVLMPRRSGKTVMIPAKASHTCGQPVPAQAWITAQKRDNAVKRWRESTDPLVLAGWGKRTIGNMHEAHRWQSGSLYRPFAPNEEALHGDDPDVVFVDEFWTLGLLEFQTIREGYSAAWSVKPGQEWLLSAAGTHASTAMKDARKRGRAATLDPYSRIAFFEWCIPETVDGAPVGKLGDEQLLELIMRHHPRAGRGLRPGFVAAEIVRNRTAAIRAYGGLDSDTSEAEMVIDSGAFRRSTNRTRRIPGRARVAFGLASDPDLRQAGISVSWKDPTDGVTLTEVIETRDQVRWSVPAIIDLLGRWEDSCVAVRSDAGGRDLADDVAAEMVHLGIDGARLVRVSASDYAAACHRIRSGLESTPEPRVLQLGERDLRRALQAAGLRRGVWVPEKGPVAVLDAHTLAAWGADHLPVLAQPKRPFRVL